MKEDDVTDHKDSSSLPGNDAVEELRALVEATSFMDRPDVLAVRPMRGDRVSSARVLLDRGGCIISQRFTGAVRVRMPDGSEWDESIATREGETHMTCIAQPSCPTR